MSVFLISSLGPSASIVAVWTVCVDGVMSKVIRLNKNHVSTKSQLGADSVGSEECVKSKMLHFHRKNAHRVKNVVNPNKNGTKK